jgi:hypothetical protein
VLENIQNGFFYEVDDNCVNVIREIGIVGACLAMI